MKDFFVGLDHPSTAFPFRCSMISVNALRKRTGSFRVNQWIMDSGAFSQISRYGKFLLSEDEYLEQIYRWEQCGTLRAAVCQDWMCEPFILQVTGKTVEEHQWLTIESFNYLSSWSDTPILPVLQGYVPEDYVAHLRLYGDSLERGAWVGIGSVCKRNGNPDAIEDVLLAVKNERLDIRLHGFGLKLQALERATIRELLYSSDSMAWSLNGRFGNGDAHDPRGALKYCAQVQDIIDQPTFIQDQLFEWWR